MRKKYKITFNSNDVNYIKEFDGIFIENRIIYIDDNIKTVIDIDKKSITRSNKDYSILLDFINDIYKVNIIENDSYLNLNIVLDLFSIKNNEIRIIYHDDLENRVEYIIEYIN